MTAFFRGAAALVVMAAPLSAQTEPNASQMKAEIDQAIHCAAVQTFVAAMVASADESNPELEENIQNSTVRWLEYADALSDDGEDAIMQRYTAESDALVGKLETEGLDVTAFTDKITEDALNCIAVEQATFGNTVKDR